MVSSLGWIDTPHSVTGIGLVRYNPFTDCPAISMIYTFAGSPSWSITDTSTNTLAYKASTTPSHHEAITLGYSCQH